MHVSTMTCLMYGSRNAETKTPSIEAAKRLRAAGFTHLDLFLCRLVRSENAEFSGEKWLDEVNALRAYAESSGIIYHQCHLPYYFIGSSYDPAQTEFNALFHTMMLRGIEICGIMGIRHAVVHPFNAPDADPADIEANVAENMRIYSEYLNFAAEKGVCLAFENMNSPQRFGSRVEDLIALVDAVAGMNTAICWDVGHGEMIYRDAHPEAIERLKGRIACLHVHDNKGVLDEHLPPFMGKINWEKIMAALKRAEYSGELNYEISTNGNTPDLLRDEAARYCVRAGEYLVRMFDEA